MRRARRSWTENAFNEHCTLVALGRMLQALGEAQAPLDLLRMASRFPEEEVLHVELCARVADRLGGLIPRPFDPDAIIPPIDPSLTPRQRATELVVRICCVGEAFSLPMLAGAMKSAAHPLTRAVLETIVEDEALHGRFGYLYLQWVEPDLRPAERDRLGRAASETLASYAPLWQRLTSRVEDGVTSEGFLLAHVHELGWMESTAYRSVALETIERSVRAPLARFGIDVKLP
ncbi:MAG: ferritin-like domain-containing protein [Minicystis sp.]